MTFILFAVLAVVGVAAVFLVMYLLLRRWL